MISRAELCVLLTEAERVGQYPGRRYCPSSPPMESPRALADEVVRRLRGLEPILQGDPSDGWL